MLNPNFQLKEANSYGKKTVLYDVNVTLNKGIYGLLGLNGARKSTLMNIITDEISRDSGSITYCGKDIIKLGAAYREKVGYMPQ